MVNRIYGLVDPRDDRMRYVGITVDPISRRLREHLSNAACGMKYPVYQWIRKLARSGQLPRVVLIEETPDRQRECFWIAHYRSHGAALLNCTDGGDGVPGHRHSASTKERLRTLALSQQQDPEYRAKVRAAREAAGPYVPTAEARRKISEANKGRQRPPITEETRQRIQATSKGRPVSAATRAKISAALKGRPGKPHSAETRAKISAIQIGTKRGPRDPATKEKCRQALLGRKHAAERVAKMRASKLGKKTNRVYGPVSAETKAKISAAKRGQKHGPMTEERKARISLAKKAAFAARQAKT